MAKAEVLSCSKFYVEIDGLTDLIVKKISGISIELQTAEDHNPIDVTGKSAIQATVTGVSNGTVTVEYVSTVQDDRLIKWYTDSHSQPTTGGGTTNKGVLKTGSIILYNQAGEEAARWNLKGIMPKTYKSSQLEAGTTELATETVELVFHSIRRIK
ncbi:phage tail protein [Nostoc sp. FACHB-133]|uniref:phage tail protein n=1 Tax=Nostoc sp. FACHB-133 TaxID=2692835 RepID=UPI0016854D71|nr:phage tail protein [Nostoc sp. FACHB-133]MBD2526803.1 phage tail protein [Nostoc sp. FACHB-133]